MTRRPQPPLPYRRQACPHRSRLRLGRWHWWITDGETGPELAHGIARTEWGCNRRIEQALDRCCPFQVVRIGHPPLHPLTPVEALAICDDLAAEGIQVRLNAGREVELCPLAELDTWQRVRAVRVVQAVTDAPVRWRAVVACPIHAGSGVPMDSCTLCARAPQRPAVPVRLRGAVARG